MTFFDNIDIRVAKINYKLENASKLRRKRKLLQKKIENSAFSDNG